MSDFRDQQRANAMLDLSLSAAIARSHALGQLRVAQPLGDTATESRIRGELDQHRKCLQMIADNTPRY